MAAPLIHIRAGIEKGVLTWEFVDTSMVGYRIELDQPPQMKIGDGDVWQAQLVSRRVNKKTRRKTAVLQLVVRVQVMQAWQQIKSIPGFWIDPNQLRNLLIWLHRGRDVVLVGPKGTGKTTLGYALCEALGWQEPCKVDMYTIRRTTDLFGTDAAHEGSTHFVRSALYDYIERARLAYEQGLETRFLVIIDELNRVHSKTSEALHGLFDQTRQVSIVTTQGSKTIVLPPNLRTVATMNLGYSGTFELDEAMKDRFQPIKLKAMPLDAEVGKLVHDTHVTEKQALAIVEIARSLRDLATGGHLSYSPSYRICLNAADLVSMGVGIKEAVVEAMCAWYDGEYKLDERADFVPLDPNSELAKALAALRMKKIVVTPAKEATR